MILTEGWDLPMLDTAIMLRPTASLCLHLQMIGRVMRSADGKRGATVLDHAGNVRRLGMATDQVNFDIHGIGEKQGQPSKTKVCPRCKSILRVAVNPCDCGYEWSAKDQVELEIGGIGGSERLVEIDARTATFKQREAAWCVILEEARQAGRSVAWAAAKYMMKFKSPPRVGADGLLIDCEASHA
jgi:superfamily II DNA or RNA helicase